MNDLCESCRTPYRVDRYDDQRWRHLCPCELQRRLKCGRCKTLATHYLLGLDGSPDRPSCYEHGVPEEEVGSVIHPEPESKAAATTKRTTEPKATAAPKVRHLPRFTSLAAFETEVRKNDYLVLCRSCHHEHRHGDRVCVQDDYDAFDTRCPKCAKAGYYMALAVAAPGVTQGELPQDERCPFCGARAREQPR